MKRMREATKEMFAALQELKKLEKRLKEAEANSASETEMDSLRDAIKAATARLEEAGHLRHFEGGRRRSTRRKRKGTRRH